MREILFRGKNKKSNVWSEGHLLFDVKNNWAYISEGYEDKSAYLSEIIPETIGQNTGLTDKNGKKIFEGDIISGAVIWLERRKLGVVDFRHGSFGLVWDRGKIEQFFPFTSMCNVEYEIVGNIHDNPDMVE